MVDESQTDSTERVYISEWPVLPVCVAQNPIDPDDKKMSNPSLRFNSKKARLLPSLDESADSELDESREDLSVNIETNLPHLEKENKDVYFGDNSRCSYTACCHHLDHDCSHRGYYETADVALAKWWRNTGTAADKLPRCSGCSASTEIMRIARRQDGRTFLLDRVKKLQQFLVGNSSSCTAHASVSSFLHKLGKSKEALKHVFKARQCGMETKELLWKEEILRRQVEAEEERRLHDLGGSRLAMPSPQQIERRPTDGLSVSEFFFKYCVRRTPLVITGAANTMLPVLWTLDFIKTIAGSKDVALKRLVRDSTQWARLEQSRVTTVEQFIDSVLKQDTSGDYLFDWSLPLHCPQLTSQLVIPKYFAGDFLQRTAAGSLYRDSWPSLFIAGADVHSELHIDAFGSNFWMAMLEGRKQWTLFSHDQKSFLYPKYDSSIDPVFEVDLHSPDFALFPLLSLAQPLQCVLEPGDILFVPAGCPHRVENLTPSVAISANFVDLSNFALVKKELRSASFVDPCAGELLGQLDSPNFNSKMFSEQTDLSWEKFKQWPRLECSLYDITLPV